MILKGNNDNLKEFDQTFDKLVEQIRDDVKPRDGGILLQYTNTFDGKIGFMLRGNFQKNT